MSPLEKLIQLRTKIILGTIFLALGIYTIKACAFGGWPFHLPEIEGGVEVTFENMRHDEERERASKKQYPYSQWEKDPETGKWRWVHYI